MALPSISPPSNPFAIPHRLPGPSRRRGGQPGNQNARKLGTFSVHNPGSFHTTHLAVRSLRRSQSHPFTPPNLLIEQVVLARQPLFPFLGQPSDPEFLPAVSLYFDLTRVIIDAYADCIPARRLSGALVDLARDPLRWIELGFKDSGISRDADSFFIVFEKSAFYSPLPAHHPRLATNLTDDQWAVLAPLIPPDPPLQHLTGRPPVLIAANRWDFTRYQYTGEFQDF